jgi:hypothetical protein
MRCSEPLSVFSAAALLMALLALLRNHKDLCFFLLEHALLTSRELSAEGNATQVNGFFDCMAPFRLGRAAAAAVISLQRALSRQLQAAKFNSATAF